MNLFQDNLDLEGDFDDVDTGSELYWYTLRTLADEEKCVASINNHIVHRRLQDRIVEVKLLKEFVIREEDFPPDSDFLPKRGFKTTKTSTWARVSNGHFRRIRIVERRPFKGMIFIRMEHDAELFKLIKSWDAGFAFLGTPLPSPMTDFEFRRTEDSLIKEIPSMEDYIKENNYTPVEGSLINVRGSGGYKKELINEPEEIEVEDEQPLSMDSMHVPTEEEIAEAKKAEIYSELKIKTYEDAFQMPKSTVKTKSKKSEHQFKVNDLVFVSHLGFKGIIQEINYEENRAVVGVQMFGRRQPVECKISEISQL